MSEGVRRADVERRPVRVTLYWDEDDGRPVVRFSVDDEDRTTARMWMDDMVAFFNRTEPAIQAAKRQ